MPFRKRAAMKTKTILSIIGSAVAAAVFAFDPPPVGSAAPQAATSRTGSHDFDFLFGEWRVHHRVKRAAENQPWLEFDGTASTRRLMDGSANVEDHTFNKPTGVSRGVAIRAYDQKTGQWAIWWIDGRDPLGALDPPVKGGFEDVGNELDHDIHTRRVAMRVIDEARLLRVLSRTNGLAMQRTCNRTRDERCPSKAAKQG